MAFPTIPTTGAGRVVTGVQNGTSGTRTFPSLTGLTKNSGDLLIAIIVGYQSSGTANAVFSGWGGGFTEFVDQSTATTMCIGAAYKWSTGSETGTFTVTQAATVTGEAAFILLSIAPAHSTTPPEGGTITTSTGTAPASNSLNPAGWGTEDTLWIAVGGSGETSLTGAFTGIGSAPTNYSDLAKSGVSADVIGGVDGGVAFRQLNAASEAPGAWSTDTSNARGAALVIAVRPGVAYTLTPADTLTLSDSLSRSVEIARTLTDTVTLSDSLGRTVGIARGFADTVDLSDDATPVNVPGAPPVTDETLMTRHGTGMGHW